jgi:REP element-mobilizing transposase RayT
MPAWLFIFGHSPPKGTLGTSKNRYFYFMGIRKSTIQQTGFYFITFTNYNWLPLIAQTNAYDLVYNWFDYLKREGHSIVGYVIMPNHIHLMLGYKESNKSINTLVGNGKRFMAYEIVNRLKEANEIETLLQLENAVLFADKIRNKKHEVFKNSFDMLHCYTQKFILQKLNYIHNNPCAKKWMLAENPLDYPHSSASFYFDGTQGVYAMESWMNWEVE